MPNELAGTLRCHLQRLVREGQASVDEAGLRWTAIDEKGVK